MTIQVACHPFPKSSSSPGEGKLVAKLLPGGGSGLETILYQYPLKLISPTSHATTHKSVLVFLLSYGGGLVAGDAVKLTIDVRAGANLSLVTQGHTKIFKSPSADVVTSQSMRVRMDPDSAVCLLPDPVQPFADSAYVQTQVFEMDRRCSLCLLDWVTAGRTARGEKWGFFKWTGRNEVWLRGAGRSGPRLLVRDTIVLSADGSGAVGQSLGETMGRMTVFGSLILRGTMLEPLSSFFMSEFDQLPRIGARDFRTEEEREQESQSLSNLEQWRLGRVEAERAEGVLWTAARARGCVVVKFAAPTVEAGREWIGSMLIKEGTVEARFGRDSLMCLR
ncbi:urease accessory protein UreD [Ophiocordyceps camponoti-floridani]|uniref:Urease accessory protein UreD n=1 Tax=Ophiocordyceps camponoti-floridani TaxID=2030778 RepID=A0A8H4Q526_9HYPO|nr:urease accessory protein UreD [Ophiocordyceps camponoti-floridani]